MVLRIRSRLVLGTLAITATVVTSCELTGVDERDPDPIVVTCASLVPFDPVIARVEPGDGVASIVYPAGADESPVAVLRVPRGGLEGPTTFTLREVGGDTLGVDITALEEDEQELSSFEPALSLSLFFQEACTPTGSGDQFDIYRIDEEQLVPQSGRYTQELNGRIEAELDHLTGFLIAQGRR